jgi:uncharacterized repeat protein (TIGR03803 family)
VVISGGIRVVFAANHNPAIASLRFTDSANTDSANNNPEPRTINIRRALVLQGGTMHSAKANIRPTGRLNISDVSPRFGTTKLAAAAIRCALTLALLALLLITARPARAQTETVLYSFAGSPDGATPQSSLTPDGKGNFYGTTQQGGGEHEGLGTVFELSPNGNGGWNETVLYSFCAEGGFSCTDGALPNGNLVFDSAGNLYGTASEGGSTCGVSEGCGVVFELSPVGGNWTETVVYSFCPDGNCQPLGGYPLGGLVIDAVGNLYGNDNSGVFELSPSGGGWTGQIISHNAVNPVSGPAIDASGNIFTVAPSSVNEKPTVFEVSPDGKSGWNTTALYTFTSSPQGSAIWSSPTLDQAGNVYGTETAWYNIGKKPHDFRGTVYKLSPAKSGWTKKILYTFTPDDSATEGNAPSGGVVLDAAGNIYGTTIQGGTKGLGTVFELVAPVGKAKKYEEQVLWNFNGGDGSHPLGGLILEGGNFYGTTSAGGSSGGGVVFELTP